MALSRARSGRRSWTARARPGPLAKAQNIGAEDSGEPRSIAENTRTRRAAPPHEGQISAVLRGSPLSSAPIIELWRPPRRRLPDNVRGFAVEPSHRRIRCLRPRGVNSIQRIPLGVAGGSASGLRHRALRTRARPRSGMEPRSDRQMDHCTPDQTAMYRSSVARTGRLQRHTPLFIAMESGSLRHRAS